MRQQRLFQNFDEKQHRNASTQELLNEFNKDLVLTCHEIWIWGGNQLSIVPMESDWRAKTEKMSISSIECEDSSFTVFFDFNSVVHHKFLPYRRTVNNKYYLQVMRGLQEAIRWKRPALWHGNCLIIMLSFIGCPWFSVKKQIRYFASATVFPGSEAMWLFSTFCHHWWDKNPIAEGPERHTEF